VQLGSTLLPMIAALSSSSGNASRRAACSSCVDSSDAAVHAATAGASASCAAARAALAAARRSCADAVVAVAPHDGGGGAAASVQAPHTLRDLCPRTCAVCSPDVNIVRGQTPSTSVAGLDAAHSASMAVDGCADTRWIAANFDAATASISVALGARQHVVAAAFTLGSSAPTVGVCGRWELAAYGDAVLAPRATADRAACASVGPRGMFMACGGVCVPATRCWSCAGARLCHPHRDDDGACDELAPAGAWERCGGGGCVVRGSCWTEVATGTLGGGGGGGVGTSHNTRVMAEVATSRLRLTVNQSGCGGDQHLRLVELQAFAPCPQGYVHSLAGDDGVCLQVDSCAASVCDLARSTCVRTGPGTHVCAARPGWARDNASVPYRDVAPPNVTCPSSQAVVTPINSTGTSLTVPSPTVVDASPYTLSAQIDGGAVLPMRFFDPAVSVNLSIGAHTLEFVATDTYSNVGRCTVALTVLDRQAPVLTRCARAVNISAQEGRTFAKLTWAVIVGGSDNSGSVLSHLAFRRGKDGDTAILQQSSVQLGLGQTQLAVALVDPSGNGSPFCNSTILVQDFDECGRANGGCHATTTCTNVPGGVLCGPCPNGTFGNRWPVHCHLRDPCATTLAANTWPGVTDLGLHTCDTYAQCVHPPSSADGTFTCSCLPGFVGSGFVSDCTDVQPPLIACPAWINRTTDAGRATAALSLSPPLTTDNAGGVRSLAIAVNSSGPSQFGSIFDFPIGVTHVQMVALDNAGNLGRCTTSVRVHDAQPPVLLCHATEVLAKPWHQHASVPIATPALSDNGGGVLSLLVTLPNSTTLDMDVSGHLTLVLSIGEHTIVWHAMDAANNTANCSQRVLVRDVDECLNANGGCAPLRRCVNTDGSRTCTPCPSGWNTTSVTECASINPCTVAEARLCDPRASCAHVGPGQHSCACTLGLQGDGTRCVDVAAPHLQCPPPRTLVASPGTRSATTIAPVVQAFDVAAGPLPVCARFGLDDDCPPGFQLCSFESPFGYNRACVPARHGWTLSLCSESALDTVCLALDPRGTLRGCNDTGTLRCMPRLTQLHPIDVAIGTTTVHFHTADPAGNAASCKWQVTTVDREPPTVENCSSFTVVARPFEGRAHAFLAAGLETTLWSVGIAQPLPVYKWSVLGSPVTTLTYAAVNVSATRLPFTGMLNIRDRFLVRFRGFVQIKRTAQYIFWTRVADDDDRAALYIDSSLVGAGQSVMLSAGMAQLELQYAEGEGMAQIVLEWDSGDGTAARQLIPRHLLRHWDRTRGVPTLVDNSQGVGGSSGSQLANIPKLQIRQNGAQPDLNLTSSFALGSMLLNFVGTDTAGLTSQCGPINVTILDNDECTTNNGGCDTAASVCTNTAGGRRCSQCAFGYRGVAAGAPSQGIPVEAHMGCELIDPCTESTHECTALANCSLTSPGLYHCQCPNGYSGDGRTSGSGCVDIAKPTLRCPTSVELDAWPDVPTARLTVRVLEHWHVMNGSEPSLVEFDRWGVVSALRAHAEDNSAGLLTLSARKIFNGSSVDAVTVSLAGQMSHWAVGLNQLFIFARDAANNVGSCVVNVNVKALVGIVAPRSLPSPMREASIDTSAIFAFHLGSSPEANSTVTLHATISGTAAPYLRLDPNPVTFTAANWSTAAQVRVLLRANRRQCGNPNYGGQLQLRSDSTDPRHHNLSSIPTTLTIVDDDIANVAVSHGSGNGPLQVAEAGGSVYTYGLTLDSEPATQVTISVAADVSKEGADIVLSSNSTFVFTTANWHVHQTLVFTVVQDPIDEGNAETVLIRHYISSQDYFYQRSGINDTLVMLSIVDDDTAALPRGFRILSAPMGPTTGGTSVTLTPEWSQAADNNQTWLLGMLADQFAIESRMFDVVRQRRVFSSINCVVVNVRDAILRCVTPSVPFPGKSFTLELRVQWGGSYRDSTPWLMALDPFEYHMPVVVSRASPSGGPISGGTVVKIAAENFLDVSTLMCHFGAHRVQASVVHSGYGTPPALECTTPAVASVGEVALRVSVNGLQLSFSAVTFSFYSDNCSIVALSVASGPIDGGARVRLAGHGFVETGSVVCNFSLPNGSAVYGDGVALSNSSIECRTPAVESPGVAMLSLSLNAQQACDSAGVPYRFYVQPTVASIHPNRMKVQSLSSQSSVSSTLVLVSGTGLAATGQCACRFNSTTSPTGCHVLNDSAVRCAAPARPISGPVTWDLALNKQDFIAAGTVYYLPRIDSCVPAAGPRIGGTAVSVRGAGFSVGRMRCRFGVNSSVTAMVLNSTSLVCNAPPTSAEAASVSVSLSADDRYYALGPLLTTSFFFHDVVQVASLHPASIPVTGRVTTVLHLKTALQLPANTSVAYVRLRSSVDATGNAIHVLHGQWLPDAATSLPITTSPTPSVARAVRVHMPDFTLLAAMRGWLPGDLEVLVSVNGVDYGTAEAKLNVFNALAEPAVVALRPASGPLAGGTLVTLVGTNFAGISSLRCLFHFLPYDATGAASADANATFASNTGANSSGPAVTIAQNAVFVSSQEIRCLTPAAPSTMHHPVATTLATRRFALASVSATNLGVLSTRSANTSAVAYPARFRFTESSARASAATGSGLAQTAIDLVVAGTLASFTIDAAMDGGSLSEAGGDMFYVELTTSRGLGRAAPVFDLDPQFTSVDTSADDAVALASAQAAELQQTATTAALAASAAAEEYALAAGCLGAIHLQRCRAYVPSNSGDVDPLLLFAVVQSMRNASEMASRDAAAAATAATQGRERVATARAIAGARMLPDTTVVREAITLASFTYNDWYCAMFDTITECCAKSQCTPRPGLRGRHLALYNTTSSGVLTLAVRLGGVQIVGSPWRVQVRPAALSPRRSTLSGLRNGSGGGSGGGVVAGAVSRLHLQPRDRFGNPRSEVLDGLFHPSLGALVRVELRLRTRLRAREINWRLEDEGGAVWAERPTDSYVDDDLVVEVLQLPSRRYRFYVRASGGHGWHGATISLVQSASGLPLLGPRTLHDFGPQLLLQVVIGVQATIGLFECHSLAQPSPDRCLDPAHTAAGAPFSATTSTIVRRPDSAGRIPVDQRSDLAGTLLLRVLVDGVPIGLDGTRVVVVAAPTAPNASTYAGLQDMRGCGAYGQYPCDPRSQFVAGEPGVLTLTARDRFGNPRGVGGEIWDPHPTLDLTSPSPSTSPSQSQIRPGEAVLVNLVHGVPLALRDRGAAVYTLSFTATVAGVYMPRLRLGGAVVGEGITPPQLRVPSPRHKYPYRNTDLTDISLHF
jgi:hypothetical protein